MPTKSHQFLDTPDDVGHGPLLASRDRRSRVGCCRPCEVPFLQRLSSANWSRSWRAVPLRDNRLTRHGPNHRWGADRSIVVVRNRRTWEWCWPNLPNCSLGGCTARGSCWLWWSRPRWLGSACAPPPGV